jgi:ABC-type amino acid transport substrate-binding protein
VNHVPKSPFRALAALSGAGCLVLIGLSTSFEVAAQEQAKPLIANFVEAPPFTQIDAQGTRSGFSIDLATMISTEIGIPVEYKDVQTSEYIQNQVTGNSQIISGVSRMQQLERSNVFSNSVATETLRLTALAKNTDALSQEPLEGLKIGIVPPAAGSEATEFLQSNIPITYQTFDC